jgi:hypothetical protein
MIDWQSGKVLEAGGHQEIVDSDSSNRRIGIEAGNNRIIESPHCIGFDADYRNSKSPRKLMKLLLFYLLRTGSTLSVEMQLRLLTSETR